MRMIPDRIGSLANDQTWQCAQIASLFIHMLHAIEVFTFYVAQTSRIVFTSPSSTLVATLPFLLAMPWLALSSSPGGLH
jgi:hypothetical protein